MAFRKTLILSLSAPLHEWLPSSSGASYGLERFVASLQDAGISRVAFLRHGNAPSLPPDSIDFDRQLSEIGKEQAVTSGESFGKDLLPFYATVMASPSPRTLDTAQLFLKAADAEKVSVRGEPVLYDGTMQPGGGALFKKIGYGSLREYVNNSNEDDRNLARLLLGRYAHEVIGAMLKVTEESPRVPNGSVKTNDATLLMVGHAVYLPSVALGVARLANCTIEEQDCILDDTTKEAEGYLVDLSSSSVSIITRPD